jgi:hypothetical protein
VPQADLPPFAEGLSAIVDDRRGKQIVETEISQDIGKARNHARQPGVFEKQVLVDVVKDVSPLMTGGFIYPFSEFATPKDQLVKRLGYQEDSSAAIKEAKSLLAAAGQSSMRSLDFMVRDLNHHKLFSAPGDYATFNSNHTPDGT